jgi:hypothetical protein
MLSEQPRARTTIFIPKQNSNYFNGSPVQDFTVRFCIDGHELIETSDGDEEATMCSTIGTDRKF